jgi:cytochrome c
MDHVNVNRVSLSALGSVLFLMLLVAFSNLVISPRTPAVPGFALPSGAAVASAAASKPAPEAPLPVLLAKADPKKGEHIAKVCETCHNFKEGAGAKIGPDLWGVVGRPVATFPGFAYSDAIKKIGGDWTYEKLNEWIKDPRAMAPGTKMAFAGEQGAEQRADVLAFLQTLSNKPVPFPKASAAETAAAAAPAAAAPAAAPAPAPKPVEDALPALLAHADAAKGKHDAAICGACHNFEKGQGPKIGPDLWGVVGRKIASNPGFAYSDSLKGVSGDWTYEELNKWITDPKALASGTKMIFPGEASAKKRADILAFLQTLADKPVPFPK